MDTGSVFQRRVTTDKSGRCDHPPYKDAGDARVDMIFLEEASITGILAQIPLSRDGDQICSKVGW